MEVQPGLTQRRTQAPEAMEGEALTTDPDEEIPPDAPKKNREPKMSPRCKRFLTSRLFKGAVFALVGAVPIFGITFVLPRILEARKCTSFFCQLRHWLISIWLASQFLYNFAASQWTDPGQARHHKPPYEATGQFELNLSNDEEEINGKDSSAEQLHILFAPNYCEKCQHWKPPRSHHCSFCEKCVLRMDHHCPFTGNCIGMRNHGHFFLMYAFAITGLLYCLAMCISAVYNRPGGSQSSILGSLAGDSKLPMFSPGIAGFITHVAIQLLVIAGLEVGVLTVGAIIALIAVLAFGCPQILYVSSGMTIIEGQFPMKEYVQIKPQVYCPLGPGFYQRGRFQNIGVLLGAQWWLRLLLPGGGVLTGSGIDVNPGLCPTPGKAGLDALKARINQVENEGVQQTVSTCKELGFNPGPAAEEPKSGDV